MKPVSHHLLDPLIPIKGQDFILLSVNINAHEIYIKYHMLLSHHRTSRNTLLDDKWALCVYICNGSLPCQTVQYLCIICVPEEAR
jgi:hypothetical protein